jgi:peptide/nickel transport system permease protein
VPGLRRSARPSPGPGRGATPPSDVLRPDARELYGDALTADAALPGVEAVEAGPEGERRRPGLSVGAWIAIAWMVFIVLVAVLAKTGIFTWGDPQAVHASCARKGPFSTDGSASGHLLGCDTDGRDMIARLALGAWTSLLVSIGAIAVGFIVGGGLGIVAGYFAGQPSRVIAAIVGGVFGAAFGVIVGGVVGAAGLGLPDAVAAVIGGFLGIGAGAYFGYQRGDVDALIANMFNVMLSVPAIVLALALVAFLQGSEAAGTKAVLPDVLILIIAIGIVAVPLVGRISRASALTWSQREFVLAARAQGARPGRIMVREVLPNVAPAMFSISLLGIAVAIVAEGTLAILGVGVRPPAPSWGNIIALDRNALFNNPHIVFEASLLIFVTVLALNYLGDVVRARFDVREAGI